MKKRSTRLEFLGTAAAGLALVGFAGVAGWRSIRREQAVAAPTPRPEAIWSFRSRPDLRPPAVYVESRGRGTSPGYIFLAPKKGPDEVGPGQDGTMMLDEEGRLTWFRPAPPGPPDTMNFRSQVYRGERVLTWWEGVHGGYGNGEYVICDGSYREIERFPAGNGLNGDHHEFIITPRNTALVAVYNVVPYDLSTLGGPADGRVLEGVAQEIDVASGEVLFEWHSIEHVDPGESYMTPVDDPANRFDYFHINSIEEDADGNWIVSARRTSAIYKIDRQTGEVIWRLGGKKSDFRMGEGAAFNYQHDARRRPDGAITLFDNHSFYENGVQTGRSRGLALEVDEGAMTASLAQEYVGGSEDMADTQGNMQTLPNGNVFVGWGSEPYLSEYDGEGNLLFNANFDPWAESYRAFRLPWTGRPDDAPAVAAETGEGEKVTLYASWNGATEVASWRVLAGPSPDRLRVLNTVARRGFETIIATRSTEPYVGVQAEDSSGQTLGPETAVELDKSRMVRS